MRQQHLLSNSLKFFVKSSLYLNNTSHKTKEIVMLMVIFSLKVFVLEILLHRLFPALERRPVTYMVCGHFHRNINSLVRFMWFVAFEVEVTIPSHSAQ